MSRLYSYSITEGICRYGDNVYSTYGIAVTDEHGNALRVLNNIFNDRKRAEELARLCNECGLSDIHLDDVIEDALI